MKYLIILALGLMVAVSSTCQANDREPPGPIHTPHAAPVGAVGAVILKRCKQVEAIQWVLKLDDGPAVETISAVAAVNAPEIAALLPELQQLEAEGGPVHTVELDPNCAST